MNVNKILILFLVFGLVFIFGCTNTTQNNETEQQTNCVDSATGNEMQISEALTIAKESECATEQGFSAGEYFCNENTGTWWIDANNIKQEGCNPACVVNVNTKTAEINWKCTGLLE